MDEIIRAAAQRGVYDGFSYRLDRAGYKFTEWRSRDTKSKCKARIRKEYTEATLGKIQVSLQINAQNICTQSMSRVSEIYRNSCADLMSICAEMMNHL